MARLVNTPANGIWLQDGALYVHVDTPASAGALLSAGVSQMTGQISQGMHDTLAAAAGADAAAVGAAEADVAAHLAKLDADLLAAAQTATDIDAAVDRIAPPSRPGPA